MATTRTRRPSTTARQKASFARHIGENSSKLGCVNACARAGLFDRDGKHLGFCMSTPNAIQTAFHFFPTADFAQTRYPGFPSEFKYRREFTDAQIKQAAYNEPMVEALNGMNPTMPKKFVAKKRRTSKK